MRFLIDAQLPPALAIALRSQGHEADHLDDVGLRSAKDGIIWKHASDTSSVLVTKDEDFVDWHRRHPEAPAVLWIRRGNASTSHLLGWLMPLLPQCVRKLEADDTFIEVR